MSLKANKSQTISSISLALHFVFCVVFGFFYFFFILKLSNVIDIMNVYNLNETPLAIYEYKCLIT